MITMHRYLLVIGLLLVGGDVLGQSFYAIRRERSIIATAGTGTSTYLGELSNPGDYLDAEPNINFGLQYFVLPRVAIRAEVNWFTLSGFDSKADDGSRRNRNLSFTSANMEISTVGIINLFPNSDRYYRRPMFNVYAYAGVGGLYFNPKAEYQGEKYALQPLQTEGVNYSRFAIVIPYGIGLRLKVNPFFNIVLEGGWRGTFTDYLDDVSTVHKDPASFSDPIAAALADRRLEIGRQLVPAGTKRGNPEKNDTYILANAKIEYYLPWAFGSNKAGAYGKKRKSFNKRR